MLTAPRQPSVQHGELANENAMNVAAQPMVVGEPVAQRMRQTQDPLAHGHMRHDLLDDVPRQRGHATRAAARAQTANLARQGHEAFVATVAAAKPGEAAGHVPAVEKLGETPGHERGHPHAIGLGRTLEGGHVLAHRVVQRGLVGFTWPIVDDGGHGPPAVHASGRRWAVSSREVTSPRAAEIGVPAGGRHRRHAAAVV
jgi:hypothetical protein